MKTTTPAQQLGKATERLATQGLQLVKENERLRAELEHVQKACAEYRYNIDKMGFFCVGQLEAVAEYARKALVKSDAGRDYHHRDEFKPLVEALVRLKTDWAERHIGLLKKASEASPDTIPPDQLRAKAEVYGWVVRDLEYALADARAKGLIA